MSFQNSIILFGLLAVAIPIIIHLLNRRRHRTVKWAAMEFILKATRESRGKKKLKHIIILTARSLAIAGLIFAFSEPFTNRLGSQGEAPDTIVLVLDRSPSMELITNEGTAGGGTSKREIAIKNVQESMVDMPETRLILIDSATGKATEISSPAALSSLANAGQSDKNCDLAVHINSAITKAIDPEEKLGNTEIWVASDMQASDWDIRSKEWATVNTMVAENENVRLRFIALNETSDSNNLVRVNRSWREGNDLVIETTVTRTNGVGEEGISITYAVNGGMQTDDIMMTSAQRTIRKRIPLQNSIKKGFGYVSINADTNLRDNVSYFVFGEKTALQTIVVSEGGESRENLRRAAALPTFNHLSAKILKPTETDEIPWSTTPLIIWQAALPEGSTSEKMLDYIDEGGLVLFFPPKEDSAASFLDLKWGPRQQAPKNQHFLVDTWNQSDGPFRDGIAGDVLPLSQVDTIARRPIIGDAVSLASYEDGELFGTRKIIGQGRAVFVSTLPDLNWSHLDHTAVHLIVIHRLLQMATERLNATGSAVVGSEVLELRPREDRERIDDFAVAAPGNAENEAGVWQLGQRIIAANRPESEDELELIDVTELKAALPDVDYTLLEERGNDEARSIISKIWRYFLYAALLFLIIEAFLTLPSKVKTKKSSNLAQS